MAPVLPTKMKRSRCPTPEVLVRVRGSKGAVQDPVLAEPAEAPEDKVEVHVVHDRVPVVLEEVHEVRRCCVTQLRLKPGNLQEDQVGPEGEDDTTGEHRGCEGQK